MDTLRNPIVISNRPPTRRRPGSIMPVVALLMVCLCGFTALSVEVATIATVKTQCQNAADAAALAGTRTLNGGATSSTSQAQANALAAATANSALGQNASSQIAVVPFASAEVSTTCGTYHYSTSSQSFSPAYQLAQGENYNLVSARVQRVIKNSFFAVEVGTSSPSNTSTIVATAVAAHRPRDIAILLDFSGSMNDESDLWNADSYYGPYYNLSNNSDPLVPAFGQYSSPTVALVSTSTAPGGQCNITVPTQGMPAEVTNYIQTPAGGPNTPAFVSQSASYGTLPAGDIPAYLGLSNPSSYSQTLNQVFGTNNTTYIQANPKGSSAQTASYYPDYFENGYPTDPITVYAQGKNPATAWPNPLLPQAGYDRVYSFLISTYGIPSAPSGRNSLGIPAFSGYTQGPAYWGKTFFQWPPDPRPSADWRSLYFFNADGVTPVNDNTVLWNSYGNWNYPNNGSTVYKINYKAILNWIKNIGPNAFPPMLRAGRIAYYTSIPSDVPASAYDHSQPNSNITDPSTRFWKEYIDYCLGVWRDPYGNVWPPGYQACSYGPDFAWGNVQISPRPSGTAPNGYKLAYMNYNDNPPRPRHRMWFGPMTMLQYISDTGISPGTIRDISTYSAKLGISSVLQDIQVNHPNDQVSMILYNRPQYSNEPAVGKFSQALYGMNRNYSAMTNSLWYPPNSTSADVSPWDANGMQTPAADNDFIYNTATHHGLMLAYNQFGGSSTLSNANAGGLGRVGANRLLILETDGMANVNTNASFSNNGAVNSYYDILPGQYITAGNYDQNATLQVAQAICNTTTGTPGTPNGAVPNPGLPGFATSNKPVIIQTIAFGIVFEIATSTQSSAVGLLQAISQIGGTTFPSSPNDPTNGFKWCIGTLSTRTQLLQQAFSNVINTGDSVSLVQ